MNNSTLKITLAFFASFIVAGTASAQDNSISLVFPKSNISFEFDSSSLRPGSFPILDEISAYLKGTKKTVTITGYASSEGSDTYNLRLSKNRANTVRTYLLISGVDHNKLKVQFMGEANPIADNNSEAGREINRRVEFKLE